MNYTIMCLQDDGLDPSYYVSAPGMFNDSLYKSSGAELKLMMDMNEYLIVEKGAMMQYMPTKKKGKVDPEEVPDIQTIAPNAEIGYMPEVDLEVPAHLHDFFADYSLAPEKQIVLENWLSPYNAKLVQDKEVGGGKYVTGEKLVQTLYPKKNYVVYYRALQLYMRQGLKVTKIHGTLKFKQSPWMKEYIEKNICKRKIAKANGDEFGVMYYKLKNNTVFGKQIENVCKHMRVELLQTEKDKKIRRLASSPLFVALFLMKNEPKGSSIDKAVCLKPKMYSILPVRHDPKTLNNPDSEDPKKKHGIQKAKGVKKCVVKRELRHDKFLECLRNKRLTRHDIYGLRSYDHQIYMERVNKIGLNPYDNKRWILLDRIRTLPYGHWRIGLYKRLVASEIVPEEAEERAMKARLRFKE
ncbi:12294_t:CDS:2 [Dentiscutata erythropus]|uniref:12294_t:CDS:1 n=1 Tax=Dentiscutata erythropus TaxID=1348616 RepID=A0A9N9HYU4_9GLOM|nr:12294_t:CDS:2 [Dentiscutata erythropus]